MGSKTEEFLIDQTVKISVSVKNLNVRRRLKLSDVLMIWGSNEHHLRQFIPEVIARCHSNLLTLTRLTHIVQPDLLAHLVH